MSTEFYVDGADHRPPNLVRISSQSDLTPTYFFRLPKSRRSLRDGSARGSTRGSVPICRRKLLFSFAQHSSSIGGFRCTARHPSLVDGDGKRMKTGRENLAEIQV